MSGRPAPAVLEAAGGTAGFAQGPPPQVSPSCAKHSPSKHMACQQTINTLKGRISELQWKMMAQEMWVKHLESEKQELQEQLDLKHKWKMAGSQSENPGTPGQPRSERADQEQQIKWLLICKAAGVFRLNSSVHMAGSVSYLPTPQAIEPQAIVPRAPAPSRMQMPQGNLLLLSHSLQELLARDTVQVELIPEKKGLFLKHAEYEVSSQRFKSSVYRRYNDFVVFQEMLLHKFPYRMVPALPPKRMLGADREFIEARRRALKRFVNLVARHPLFSEDVVLKLFLSFSGSDVQNKLKESAQCVGDEFMNCKLATRAKDFLPADIQAQFAISRELIRNIYNSFHKLQDRAERIAASRAIDNAAGLLIFGKELSAIGSDTTLLPSWAALNSSTWGSLKWALKGLSVEFALPEDKAAQQGKQAENDVVEKLNLFLDLLQSYKDLCEWHEKGVLHKHQRALHKYSLMKRQMMSAAVQNCEPESVEQLESRIVEQENAIQTMELRNYFSLYCLHQETQLIHVYLPLTSHILRAFVNSQIQGHKEMSKVWNDLRPKLTQRPDSTALPAASPPEDGLCPH
uniref:LOW QUALITY PROTEIN: sorting nexin-8-like n=1 Tax=Callithrix jacchus TaxID=9483 RepID=UPI0023DCEE5C|nr:LOW QUALITY PROTEIN: sorting nexin-8-like [Callithrix jacchus]